LFSLPVPLRSRLFIRKTTTTKTTTENNDHENNRKQRPRKQLTEDNDHENNNRKQRPRKQQPKATTNQSTVHSRQRALIRPTGARAANEIADEIANEIADNEIADEIANEIADEIANEIADNEIADEIANEIADEIANEIADNNEYRQKVITMRTRRYAGSLPATRFHFSLTGKRFRGNDNAIPSGSSTTARVYGLGSRSAPIGYYMSPERWEIWEYRPSFVVTSATNSVVPRKVTRNVLAQGATLCSERSERPGNGPGSPGSGCDFDVKRGSVIDCRFVWSRCVGLSTNRQRVRP
jgi:hypothetical protein